MGFRTLAGRQKVSVQLQVLSQQEAVLLLKLLLPMRVIFLVAMLRKFISLVVYPPSHDRRGS